MLKCAMCKNTSDMHVGIQSEWPFGVDIHPRHGCSYSFRCITILGWDTSCFCFHSDFRIVHIQYICVQTVHMCAYTLLSCSLWHCRNGHLLMYHLQLKAFFGKVCCVQQWCSLFLLAPLCSFREYFSFFIVHLCTRGVYYSVYVRMCALLILSLSSWVYCGCRVLQSLGSSGSVGGNYYKAIQCMLFSCCGLAY